MNFPTCKDLRGMMITLLMMFAIMIMRTIMVFVILLTMIMSHSGPNDLRLLQEPDCRLCVEGARKHGSALLTMLANIIINIIIIKAIITLIKSRTHISQDGLARCYLLAG